MVTFIVHTKYDREIKNKLVERSEGMFHTDRLQIRKYTMDDLQFYASLWETKSNALYWKQEVKNIYAM